MKRWAPALECFRQSLQDPHTGLFRVADVGGLPQRAPLMRRILPAAFLLGYAVFLAAYFAPVPAGSDSSGYFNSARLLAEGRMSTPLRTLPGFEPSTPWVYTPHGFTPEGRQPGLTPTYPSGLPLQYVLAVKAAGWKWGPTLVAVLASVMGVVLTFFILRELEVRESLAFAGAALLAVSPLFLQASFTPMSDVPATAWLALEIGRAHV